MPHITDISAMDLDMTRGGDGFEATWGFMLGAGFLAGLTGGTGFLLLGAGAGFTLFFF